MDAIPFSLDIAKENIVLHNFKVAAIDFYYILGIINPRDILACQDQR